LVHCFLSVRVRAFDPVRTQERIEASCLPSITPRSITPVIRGFLLPLEVVVRPDLVGFVRDDRRTGNTYSLCSEA